MVNKTKNKSMCSVEETDGNQILSKNKEFNINSAEIQSDSAPVSGETPLTNGQCSVSQLTHNTNSASNNGIDKKKCLEMHHDSLVQSENYQSLAIPEGLVMDPLAPTALAVSTEFMDRIGSGLTLLREHGKKVQKYVWKNRKFDILKKSWKSIVNVVLIEAKDLPDGPAGHLYCKFRLGNETHKSKQVTSSKATWCERFNIHLYEESHLEVTVWHKGKQKNFMGRCSLDLSQFEKEKTHDIWQELECGFGSIHILVTVNLSARSIPMDNVPTTTGAHKPPTDEEYTWYRFNNGIGEVGELCVTVHGARGLSGAGIVGKANSYCVLELHNSRVQTHTVPGTCEPFWNKNYTFAVNDVTATLDITVYEDSPLNDVLGTVSIPLLRIENNEKRWYALKNRSKKSAAKGNLPRIQLQMSLVWNPIKASLRVLSPIEHRYTEKKQNKFQIPLIYSNLKFIKDIFSAVMAANEQFKNFLEWENRETNAVALLAWLTFWLYFHMWMTPLLLLVPFIYYWALKKRRDPDSVASSTTNFFLPDFDNIEEEDEIEVKNDNSSLKTRLYGLQDLTLTIKNGIDYIVSLLERIRNLANFSVPYLSYLAMIALVTLSAAFYLFPVNYLFMAFGIYKFGRKAMNPERTPNNDILDFLSRVPDDEILKQWRELKVPEPKSNSPERQLTNGEAIENDKSR